MMSVLRPRWPKSAEFYDCFTERFKSRSNEDDGMTGDARLSFVHFMSKCQPSTGANDHRGNHPDRRRRRR